MGEVEKNAAAVALGKRGGAAGKGASKRRGDSEFYRSLVAKRRDRESAPSSSDIAKLIRKMDGTGIFWRIGQRGHTYEGCPAGLTAALRWMVKNRHAQHSTDWKVRPTETGRALV